MIIGINIDGVLRNHLNKLIITHKKYHQSEIDVKDIVDYDLEKYFKFTDDDDSLDKFLYEDCSLEIFGSADEIEDNVITKLNTFISKNREKLTVKIMTRECGRAIPATLFFLSKTGSMCKEIKFINSYEEMWDECDILVTTFPKVLETKPKNKISIKVERNYNKKIKSNKIIKNLSDFLEDEDYINKITSTKTVDYKELN